MSHGGNYYVHKERGPAFQKQTRLQGLQESPSFLRAVRNWSFGVLDERIESSPITGHRHLDLTPIVTKSELDAKLRAMTGPDQNISDHEPYPRRFVLPISFKHLDSYCVLRKSTKSSANTCQISTDDFECLGSNPGRTRWAWN